MKCFLLLMLIVILHVHGQRVIIPQGKLRGGNMTSRLGKTFYAYWKIPYAKPPIGILRFSAPKKPDKWIGTRDASTNDGVMCPQRNVGLVPEDLFVLKGTEDCLYLSVFTPYVDPRNKTPLPVLVWIHGGAFEHGSYSENPPQFLMDKDIVVVSMNYRLGPLGFLSMEDGVLPGNWGLKDQSFALQWIRDNIIHFGGNPEMVTIFGESAGGASIHYHIVSPMSRGLFQRAISNSGSVFSPWGLGLGGGDTRNNTIKLAKIQHCPTGSSRALLNCMRRKSMKNIIEHADTDLFDWFLDPMTPFKPVVEGSVPISEAFLPENPVTAYKTGNIAQVPWLVGINKADGALRVSGIYNSTKLVKELNDDFDRIIPISLYIEQRTDNVPAVTKKLRRFYYGNKPVGINTISETTDIWTDAWFFAGIDHAVRLHLSHVHAPVYLYYFSYSGTHSFSAAFGNGNIDFGTCHCDDLLYLFPVGYPYSLKDKKYINYFVNMWTDFTINGNPTPRGNRLGVHWDPVKTDRLEHLHIGDRLRMETDLLRDRRQFCRNINIY